MNKLELKAKVAAQVANDGSAGNKKVAGVYVEAVIKAIRDEVAAGRKVVISNFGVFEPKVIPGGRTIRVPARGGGFKEVVTVERRAIGFHASKPASAQTDGEE